MGRFAPVPGVTSVEIEWLGGEPSRYAVYSRGRHVGDIIACIEREANGGRLGWRAAGKPHHRLTDLGEAALSLAAFANLIKSESHGTR